MNVYIYDDEIIMRKSDGAVIVEQKDIILNKIPVNLIESVIVLGNTTLTGPIIRAFAENKIQVIYCSRGGRPIGVLSAFRFEFTELRIKQFLSYMNARKRLTIAKYICKKKFDSQKDFLRKRRNVDKSYIYSFEKVSSRIDCCTTLNALRGIEGKCAGIYFEAISTIAAFEKRTRRPATDYFNALLNLTYAIIPVCQACYNHSVCFGCELYNWTEDLII